MNRKNKCANWRVINQSFRMTMEFNVKEDYTLEDERVFLRPLQRKDIEFLLPFAMNEPETWTYSHLSAAGEEGMTNYINAALKSRTESKEYAFIVFDKMKGNYAGSTRFYDIQPAWQTLQLGYTWYGAEFRGTGLNKHCKYLMLQFAFDTLLAERVEFRADARNQRSIAAMKNIGCIPEGVLRQNMPLQDGTRRGLYHFKHFKR